jgi:protein N-terminal methyltransferase
MADCGAGIGRVTRDVLLPAFDHVDLLEQSPRLIAAAPEYIGEEGSKRVTFLCQGMQVRAGEIGMHWQGSHKAIRP